MFTLSQTSHSDVWRIHEPLHAEAAPEAVRACVCVRVCVLMDEGARGIAQIECLKQGRMFMEHLWFMVSVSEDIGQEETSFSLCNFMLYSTLQ